MLIGAGGAASPETSTARTCMSPSFRTSHHMKENS